MKTKFFIICLLILNFGCKKGEKLPNSYSNENVGVSANDLLSASKYTSLKIEINYMPNHAPDAGAINHFQNLLNSLLNKPGGIEIVQKQISSGNKDTYALTDLKTIEKSNRTVYTKDQTMGVYMLITDADYSDNRVLGIAYRNTSFALMGKTIHNNSGGIGQASVTKLEATVLEHEFGHLMGLVNIGSSMQTYHQDANGAHCDNANCLMNSTAETTDILGFLVTGSIPNFDKNCLNDLKANGGK
ncbi:MAG: hypothetical protein HYZ42_12975 [Bacteroidetes bacterium]|nr:hypothetical protein [Bacteroidota bacterium]